MAFHEDTRVEAIEHADHGVRLLTYDGIVLADRVLLATNGFPPLVRAIRHYVVPVYDHVLMTEPLSTAQRDAIGWEGREGLADAATRFGAPTALDLVDGLGTERTRLSLVRRKPVPFPPEPLRWWGIRTTIRAMHRADRTSCEGLWLKLLDRLGLGFQS